MILTEYSIGGKIYGLGESYTWDNKIAGYEILEIVRYSNGDKEQFNIKDMPNYSEESAFCFFNDFIREKEF